MTPSKLLKRLPHRRSRQFPPRGLRSRRHRRARFDKDAAEAMLADDVERLGDLQQRLYRARTLGGAGRAAGRWTPPARTASSSTSCPASTRRAAGACVQGAERGGARARFPLARGECGCRSADASASSTAPTTRRCWWCACIRKCWQRQKLPPTAGRQGHLEGALPGHPRLRAPSRAQRHRCAQVLSARLAGGAAPALLERLDEPAKRWKFSMGDIAERKLWDNTWRPTRT